MKVAIVICLLIILVAICMRNTECLSNSLYPPITDGLVPSAVTYDSEHANISFAPKVCPNNYFYNSNGLLTDCANCTSKYLCPNCPTISNKELSYYYVYYQ
jgi:hypothetical protein